MENEASGRTGDIVLWRVAMESTGGSDIVRTLHRHTGKQPVFVSPSKVNYNLTVLVHHTVYNNVTKKLFQMKWNYMFKLR